MKTNASTIIIIFLLHTLVGIAQPTWVTSGAPIGDTSVFEYNANWATFTIGLADTNTIDSVAISSITGTPDGVHLYRVDESPNTLTGTNGVGGNTHYFGAFVVGGTTPTYTVEYRYDEAVHNPVPGTEVNNMLFYREDNAVTAWVGLATIINTTTNIITRTNESERGEYILGNSGGPLPIELLEFSARLEEDEKVRLYWTTATEINNDYYIIEKSFDGINFEFLAQVSAVGNSSTTLNYHTYDYEPAYGVNYYRLKQVDVDESYSYSQIEAINLDHLSITTVYPVPAVDAFNFIVATPTDQSIVISIVDAIGRTVYFKEAMVIEGINNFSLDAHSFASGTYVLRVVSEKQAHSFKNFVIKKR